MAVRPRRTWPLDRGAAGRSADRHHPSPGLGTPNTGSVERATRQDRSGPGTDTRGLSRRRSAYGRRPPARNRWRRSTVICSVRRIRLGDHGGWAIFAAVIWYVVFALMHLFWAVGGSFGLASSAGHDLVARRPTIFVVFGLYGVAAILLTGSAMLLAIDHAAASRLRTAALFVLLGTGVALMLRGVVLELVLAADIGGVRAQIGPVEAPWSLILWNPWFALGGSLLIAASVQAHRRPAKEAG